MKEKRRRESLMTRVKNDEYWIQHMAMDFLEPRHLSEHKGEYVTAVFNGGGCECGVVDEADDKDFMLNDGRSATPFSLQNVKYFYLGREEDFCRTHGYDLPTSKARDFIVGHKYGYRIPSQLAYRFLYNEEFEPMVIERTIYDKNLLLTLCSVGYIHSLNYEKNTIDDSFCNGRDLENEVRDMAVTFRTLCGDSDDEANLFAKGGVIYLKDGGRHETYEE